MAQITSEIVTECLKTIKGPDLEGNIISRGMVSPIMIDKGKIIFSITVPSSRTEELEPLRLAAQKAVMELDGVTSAMVVFTAEREAGSATSTTPNTATGASIAAKRAAI